MSIRSAALVLVTLATGAAAYFYLKPTPKWQPSGKMIVPRFQHMAAPLDDSRVIVFGGKAQEGGKHVTTASAEIWDARTGQFTKAADMNVPRTRARKVKLQNGALFVVGGTILDGPAAKALASAELWSPKTKKWVFTATPTQARLEHAMTVLDDGRVLVAGGQDRGMPLKSAEVFDPSTGAWSRISDMPEARVDHRAVTLPDGRVLVAGGITKAKATQSAVWDPKTDAWQRGPEIGGTLCESLDTKEVAAIGYVAVYGDEQAATLYLHSGDSARTGPPLEIGRHSAVLEPLSGRRLIVSGGAVHVFAERTQEEIHEGQRPSAYSVVKARNDIYDLNTDSWTRAPDFIHPRRAHSVTQLSDGELVAIGGYGHTLVGIAERTRIR